MIINDNDDGNYRNNVDANYRNNVDVNDSDNDDISDFDDDGDNGDVIDNCNDNRKKFLETR